VWCGGGPGVAALGAWWRDQTGGLEIAVRPGSRAACRRRSENALRTTVGQRPARGRRRGVEPAAPRAVQRDPVRGPEHADLQQGRIGGLRWQLPCCALGAQRLEPRLASDRRRCRSRGRERGWARPLFPLVGAVRCRAAVGNGRRRARSICIHHDHCGILLAAMSVLAYRDFQIRLSTSQTAAHSATPAIAYCAGVSKTQPKTRSGGMPGIPSAPPVRVRKFVKSATTSPPAIHAAPMRFPSTGTLLRVARIDQHTARHERGPERRRDTILARPVGTYVMSAGRPADLLHPEAPRQHVLRHQPGRLPVDRAVRAEAELTTPPSRTRLQPRNPISLLQSPQIVLGGG
jgi:hypothetical protein